MSSRHDAQAIADLGALVARQSARARELATLLEAEARHLRRREIDSVAAVAEEKDALVRALESESAERDRLLSHLGLDRPRDGWPGGLGPGLPAELSVAWRELRATLERCRRMNASNGMTVAALRRYSGRLAAILTGNESQPGVYGPRGRSGADGVPRYSSVA